MSERTGEEYQALRATIRQRGTMRTGAFLCGIATWALAALAASVVAIPLVALIPLALLVATFEAVFALHVGVERIGRYLQVFHDDRWEQVSMGFGKPMEGTASDPLFIAPFLVAALCNFVPVVVAGPIPVELAVLAGGHLLFGVRLASARRAAGRQRAADLERFRQMKSAAPVVAGQPS